MGDSDDFLPLHAVLAWVYSRDAEFTAAMNIPLPVETSIELPSADSEIYAFTITTPVDQGTWPLAVARATFCESRKRPITPAISSVEEAWQVLRHRIYKDKLEIVGLPFFRGKTDLARTSDMWGLNAGWLLKEFAPVRVKPLMGLELAPRPGLIDAQSPPTWWRDVSIEKGIMALFPEVPSVTAHDRKKKTNPKKMTPKYRNITRAIAETWPEGDVLADPVGVRYELIKKWFAQNGKMKNGKQASVSDATLYRYFEDLEAGLIDGF